MKIRTRGWAPLFRAIGARRRIVSDLRPVWRALHPHLLAHVKRNFLSQGTHGGPRWANHDSEPRYRAFKGGIVLHEMPLRWGLGAKHNRLMPSLTNPTHPDALVEFRADRLRIGTKVPYAARLKQGGVGPFGERFPGRNPLQMKNNQWRRHVDWIRTEIIKMAQQQ